ncbi:MAG: S8 family serine peptidase [Bacteroidetes bacterium]|nr:S8 family serine peptidase [Bacteroidota bacterium]
MKKIFTVSLLFLSLFSFGQTAEQREVIQSFQDKNLNQQSYAELRNIVLEKEIRIQNYLSNNPDKEKSFTKDGRPYLLYDVSKEGKPIYITTKDVGQSTNSKSTSLYATGSIGVNITGTNMIAGVWDGGQVNANHQSLTGQAVMQTGQALSSNGGNNHQQAVTGIMVGKDINNARGIAYGAKSKNYDWDNDLTEMNAFADSGYLISNHSYGYSNDTSIALWNFGAYDGQSKAWDILLKTKPFYLPFVAGGNEQQSSGNPIPGGYDIITGSSASKNVVTVGAINNDNTMSSYSNWGPTDDGRIKPDIVTLGTSIDVPLYANDTGYTGNVSASSGTSYASPAAAAGALLLQQYYFSLNNSYMKASMLKALLLHSADDDTSNNGPDAKFGWGILNIEKAANIIKQNSLTNGTAKMLMIPTNPNNNDSDQIVNNYVFDQNGVRASLGWIDDEGTEQTIADGVNNNTSRLVYKFSMKLEQVLPALAAFPYNNLSVTNPSVSAAAGTNWFQSGNNYLQANLSNTTNNATGKISIRKSSTSPSTIRELALIVTGLKTNTPLSINLTNFVASCLDFNSVKINWETASENNCDRFEIEKSDDGAIYYKIETVNSKHNSIANQQYHFVDKNAVNKNIYYRLKIVYANGLTEYSKSISSNCNTGQIQQKYIVFYDKVNKKIRLISNNDKLINEYQIYTIDGKLLSSGSAHSNEIDFSFQPQNTYIIKYEVDNQIYSMKFLN